MLKAADLARREDRRVKGVKIGKTRRDWGISHVCLILAGKEDMHESLDEFEFRQICNRVTALD